MKGVWRDHGLALFFGLILLAALAGQALAGVAEYNNQQLTDGLQEISLGQYLTSSSFAVDVAENWQSELGHRNPNPSEPRTPPPGSRLNTTAPQTRGRSVTSTVNGRRRFILTAAAGSGSGTSPGRPASRTTR
jgi:hypothetical protein